MSRELRVHSVPTTAEHVRTIIEIAAIVAAGIWALYTFVYEQRIKPLSEAPSFAVPTIVDQGPTVNGVVFLAIHKQLDNTGNVGIDLAAEALSVYGETLTRQSTVPMRTVTATKAVVQGDVHRIPVKLLYSSARLRSGAVHGDHTSFFVPPHSSNAEDFLIAVPAKKYPVVLITRKDYVTKSPGSQPVSVRIVRGPMGAYDLQSPTEIGEYDSDREFPIRP